MKSGITAMLLAALFLVPSFRESPADTRNSIAASAATKITLERGMCFGTCPVYKAEIFGNGRVVFSSDERYGDAPNRGKKAFAYPNGVLLPGEHLDHIDPKAVAKLVQKFDQAHFFQLKNKYAAQVTDMPYYRLTLSVGGRSKSVDDYVGTWVGMPKSVVALEDEVDRVAGTARWVDGTIELLPWLESQKFDFHSDDAAQLAAAASYRNESEALAIAMIDRGAPLSKMINFTSETRFGEPKHLSVAQVMIEGATATGNVKLFKKLAASAWFKKIDNKRLAEIFATAQAACSPTLVDAVSAAGISIDEPERIEPGGGDDYARGQTALSLLVRNYKCSDRPDLGLETVKHLLAHAADPNHLDSKGQTPIFSATSGPLFRALLAAGADTSVKDQDGHNALFWSYDDEVAMALLARGNSPAGINQYCQSLFDLAKERNMPRLAKWLKAHPSTWRNSPETKKPCKPPEL
jgi:hypothetical protein